MRKFKLAPFMLIPAIFGLSSCTLPSWLSFLSFIPGLEAPEKEEKQPEKKEEEGESYSLEKVVEDINTTFAGLGIEDFLEYDSDYEVYSGGVLFDEGDSYASGAQEESVLKSGVLTLAQYMPSYLGKATYQFWSGEDDYWEDSSGDTVAQQYYDEVPGGKVAVELICYAYNSRLIGSVSVFDAAKLA